MARKSKHTDQTWEIIGKRLLAGESAASLAREYGVSKGLISQRFSKPIKNVNNVANQIIETEKAISLLNVNERIAAFNLVEEKKRQNANMSDAANDVSIVTKMYAKAAKDATSQIMFKSMSDDGVTVSPERLATCAEETTAVMKSIILVNESSKLPLKLIEIESKSKEPIEPPKDDAPVRFYIPDNGRK